MSYTPSVSGPAAARGDPLPPPAQRVRLGHNPPGAVAAAASAMHVQQPPRSVMRQAYGRFAAFNTACAATARYPRPFENFRSPAFAYARSSCGATTLAITSIG